MHFREANATDRERILDLRNRCFGDVDPEKADPRFWDWEFSRARMFVADGGDEGELASHLALLEWPHMLDGSPVRGALAVDAMTAPQARGQGAFTNVVRYAVEHNGHAVATAYQIRKQVLGAMLRGGWTVAEKVPILIRPILLPGKDEARRPGRQAGLPVLHSGDVLWMSDLGLRDGCIARTPEFIRWRFFENPHWRYRVTGIPNRGYLAARRTTLKGYDTLAIADLAFADKRAARLLLREAVAHARAEGCRLVAAFVSRRHPAFWKFVRSGFLPGPHWFRLLVHPPEQAKRPWRVMWADTDHL